jgi:GGDEF domain-containing protein
MSLQGPMIVVADNPAPDIVDALAAAGAFPIVESRWPDAPATFVAVQPSAIVLAEPGPASDTRAATTLGLQLKTRHGPFIPLIGRARGAGGLAIPHGLPIDADTSANRLIARLRTALRVRSLHATVLRRAETFKTEGAGITPILPKSDPIEDATVLVAGRGRSYPALAVAIGERAGLIGALSVETAARYLNAREVDGVVIGDGLSPKVVEALLTVLAEDPRFRDLPVAVTGGTPALLAEFGGLLVNMECIESDPVLVTERILPLVRLHAFDARLKRILKAFDSEGVIDSQTGLLTRDAFWRELSRAQQDAEQRGVSLSLARFTFEPADQRTHLDTARLVSRIVRNIDFACQGTDGSILCVFTGTDLRSAHVIARRIAGVLKHTMLTSDKGLPKLETNITLGALKPSDTAASLLARVGPTAFAVA